MDSIFEYLGMASGIAAIAMISLVPSLMRQGIALNMLAAVSFMVMAFITDQWGIFTAQAFYFVFGVIGLYTYRNGVTVKE
ncbi:MAG: hypothetical protein IM547_01570 [Chitinophagaceae bacterium]|nr:hypothetical protein [Chitinophagaceae bacterium]